MRTILQWLLLLFLPSEAKAQRLLVEVIALRQQLHSLKLKSPKAKFSRWDKVFWVMLSRLWAPWRKLCVLVKPETVLRWHRQGFRLFWQWKSRRKPLSSRRQTYIALIRRMAKENPRWGAPRIHGELKKLGFKLSERTVSRYMPKKEYKPDTLKRKRQQWKTFLTNHRDVLAAMDFLVVPTWNFRPLYLLVIIEHGKRVVRHIHATAHPTAAWVKQQLREAFPYDEMPKYLIFDRDVTLGATKAFMEAMGIKPKITAYHSPWQNGVCERMNGTLRRELLDHVVVLNEAHLVRLVKEYLRYYHEDRTHLALGKDAPRGRPIEEKPSEVAKLQGIARCGGLHHRYTWDQAA